MNDRNFLERTKQFALYLAELQTVLDPESYALLLRILKGFNEAIVHRENGVDIPFSPREKELLTPEFGRVLTRLAGYLGPHGMQVVVGTHGSPPPAPEHDRSEVDAIARASGMSP
ncbi:hypothetical protein IPZ58_36445 [Streptomyces roseoverticillatus]|uniref:hypothetical protein n=1 Tax=Streptomyces roseoverticillatus TaxID=66429 RepID=UPI001F3391DA|nr:hypothetical protein [Streptomyces roseoverticillatus]MCF3107006.1 hypothetical protein [Streptomyces roseoverticillatus]